MKGQVFRFQRSHGQETRIGCMTGKGNHISATLKPSQPILVSGHQLVTMALAPFLPTELVVSSLIIIVLVFPYIA
uniref:Uncharacterized protein n=1 Tax=Leersia perrieri TaxID=77586 RepID=A0A0D9X5Y8_9ORYZ